MSQINKAPDFIAMGEQLKEDAMRYAKVVGLTFFQNSFYNQGFTDEALEPWEARKNNFDPGRKILVKTLALLDSLAVTDDGGNKITFYSDEPYADIHNNGGTLNIRITKKSRKYFWFMFKATGKERWKWMALSKKDTMKVVIPARPFIQESATLMRELDEWLLNTIITRFKTL